MSETLKREALELLERITKALKEADNVTTVNHYHLKHGHKVYGLQTINLNISFTGKVHPLLAVHKKEVKRDDSNRKTEGT